MKGRVRAFLGTKPVNVWGSSTFPPVICQRKGKAFKWHDGKDWQPGDELPTEIANALPGPEWNRCENHRHLRMAERRAA